MSVCSCVSEVDDQAIPLLWPLKPTLGVLCWYIKTGRKGGSRIMQCSAAARRARMGIHVHVHACVSVQETQNVLPQKTRHGLHNTV